MTATEQDEPTTARSRLLAVVMTILLCGLAVHDQLTSGEIDSALLGALVVLIFFWTGQGVDELAKRLLR